MSTFKLFFLLVAALNLHCVSVTTISFAEDKKVAEESTLTFHQLLNEGKYDELYDLTDSRAKATKSKLGFINVMTQVRTQFGKLMDTSLVENSVISRADYREVHSVYRAQFENGIRLEKFVWYVNDRKAGLFMYQTDVLED